MTIYVDPRLIGKNNYEKLVSRYQNITFITDIYKPSEIEVLITMPKIVKEMDLSNYPNLKWIQYLMAGYDGVDLELLKSKGIVFCNAQNIFSKSIAEDVFTKIFYFNRNIPHYIESKKSKTWEPIKEELELTNSTVLILGVGSIGKELARRFKAFETYVIGYRQSEKPEESFDEIITTEEELNLSIQRADYVILALPLTENTMHLFDKEKFSMMKQTALFINVARGPVVKQTDMIKVLEEKLIRGAALDVFDKEPLPKNNTLWNLDNVYITPHNASSSQFMKDRLYDLIIMNLDLYLEGKPLKYKLN